MTIETFFQGDSVEITSDTDFDDLGNASLIEFVVIKPSGEIVTWTATQVGATQDIVYTTSSTDLDEVGTYKIQSHVEWDDGASDLHGEIQRFKVKLHLEGDEST
jgi:hypothetical protein